MRLLARTSFRQGRDSVAMAMFERLGDAALDAEDRYILGLALSRAGKTRSAIRVWEDAPWDATSTPATLLQLVRGYFNADQLDEATRTAELLRKWAGWESQAMALLGMISLEQDDPGRAADYWRNAVKDAPPSPDSASRLEVPRKDLARVLLRVGQPGEAREQLRSVLAEGPDPEASWLLARTHLQQKDWAAARADLERSRPYRDANPMARDPAPYVGSPQCATCHPGEFQAQHASRHARTFFHANELARLRLPSSPVRDPSDARVVHTFIREQDGSIRQETRAGGKVFEAVVQYAFGSGDRGLTPVGRDAHGQAYELRLSDYPEAHGNGAGGQSVARWDVTSGHPTAPGRPEEYLGQPLTEDLVRRCLFCHVTDLRAAVENTGPCASDRGIGCERCHGPGGNHLLAVEAKLVDIDPAIARPSHATGEPIVKLCGQCHSPRGREIRRDDPAAPRFQATTLTWSRCYTESQNALDCITCHDPHRNASTSMADYEARCLECHSKPGRQAIAASPAPHAGERPRPRSRLYPDDAPHTPCPVNPSTGCIACHMPSVPGIVPHSSFTDHNIRVHRD